MTTEQIERLRILAAYLRSLPPEKSKRFFMDTWFLTPSTINRWEVQDWTKSRRDMAKRLLKQEKLPECFTAACAAGWATTIPQFKDTFTRTFDGNVALLNAKGGAISFGLAACGDFFGTYAPFNPESYERHPKPKDVAKYIDQLVAAEVK